ncbi:MAG TPA: PASTA domain-containing protein [Actinomycetota bacterium]
MITRLAEDASGSLWTAVLTGLGKPVTVHLLSGPETLDPTFGHDFSERMQAMFPWPDHPNVAAVFNYGRDERARAFFVLMEPLTGETLGRRIERSPCLPPPESLRIAAAVARGLEVVHGRGIAHGRLRPDSVLLTRDGGVKLLGLGVPPDRPGRDTPEDDIAALAGVVHQMLVEDLDARALDRTTDLPPRAAGPPFPGLPAEVRQLLERCLDPTPTVRPTASDLASALGGAAHPLATRSVRSPGSEDARPVTQARDPGTAPTVAGAAVGPVVEDDAVAVEDDTVAAVPDSTSTERPERRRRRPVGRWIAGFAILSAMAVTVSIVLASRGGEDPLPDRRTPPAFEGTTVPDVLGLLLAEAEDLLGKAGLQVTGVREVAGKPGFVVRTDPTPGEAVRMGASVTVFVGRSPPSG